MPGDRSMNRVATQASMNSNSFSAASDVRAALGMLRVVLFLAFSDVKARYKRSVWGPLWITLGTSIGTVGLGMLWSELFKLSPETLIPSLTVGLILWQFFSGIIIEAPSMYANQANIIRNIRLPLFIFPLLLITKHVINLAHNIPILIGIFIYFRISMTPASLLVLPALLLVTLTMLSVSVLLGILGARFRDLTHIVGVAMPMLMFLSPVFYRPRYLPFNQFISWFNPFSHWIEIIRYPLLGETPDQFLIWTNVGMLLVTACLAAWQFHRKFRHIAYWI